MYADDGRPIGRVFKKCDPDPHSSNDGQTDIPIPLNELCPIALAENYGLTPDEAGRVVSNLSDLTDPTGVAYPPYAFEALEFFVTNEKDNRPTSEKGKKMVVYWRGEPARSLRRRTAEESERLRRRLVASHLAVPREPLRGESRG